MIINNNISVNKAAASVNQDAAPLKKLTSNQCREMTTKFWRWMGYENEPAIAVLPVYDEYNDPWSNHHCCIDYKEIGRVSTVGATVIIEWLYTEDTRSKSHYLFEFETPVEAQAFAKRIKRGKHQTLIAGEDCIRVVMISSNPRKKEIRSAEDVEAICNTVSHIGKAMTKGTIIYYEFLAASTYEELIGNLANSNRETNQDNISIVIGEIDDSKNIE
jgi:hypothetical protein